MCLASLWVDKHAVRGPGGCRRGDSMVGLIVFVIRLIDCLIRLGGRPISWGDCFWGGGIRFSFFTFFGLIVFLVGDSFGDSKLIVLYQN